MKKRILSIILTAIFALTLMIAVGAQEQATQTDLSKATTYLNVLSDIPDSASEFFAALGVEYMGTQLDEFTDYINYGAKCTDVGAYNVWESLKNNTDGSLDRAIRAVTEAKKTAEGTVSK